MLSALGHCEDSVCSQSSSNHEIVRLFRCSIHCDRLLCLSHLNAHNIYYEEEKKQNHAVLNELENSLILYQSIFEQQIQVYRELVHQASTLLLHDTPAIIPVEKIRPVLEKLQQAIAISQQEKIIIKDEPELDMDKTDSSLLKDTSFIKTEPHSPPESSGTVVVRLKRIDCNKEVQHEHNDHTRKKDKHRRKSKDSDNESISGIPDENRLRKSARIAINF